MSNLQSNLQASVNNDRHCTSVAKLMGPRLLDDLGLARIWRVLGAYLITAGEASGPVSRVSNADAMARRVCERALATRPGGLQ
jgi:hypothetical protein